MHWQQPQASGSPSKFMYLEDQTLREAFQMHPQVVPLAQRKLLLEEILGAGMRRCQIGSLVREDRMPQMAGTERLFQEVAESQEAELWVMVFNRQGLTRARQAGFRHVALSASISEIHSKRNLACSVDQALNRCRQLAEEAGGSGMQVRMGLQCAFGGPMLPPPEPEELLELLSAFKRLGVGRLVLCDTAGRAKPSGLRRVLAKLRPALEGAELGLHLHGQPDQLAANLAEAWDGGVDWLDVSLGGRGGCPFLPGRPPRNLSTLQAVEFLAQKGVTLDLDMKKMARAQALLDSFVAAGKDRLWK
jgi:hydroxymethylglutaryl-CoA lyase